MAATTRSLQIAEDLFKEMVLTKEDLTIIQGYTDAAASDLLPNLVSSGRVKRIDVLRPLAAHGKVELIDPSIGFVPDPSAIRKLESTLAVAEVALPIRLSDDVLTIAAVDPFDEPKRIRLEQATGLRVRLALAPVEELTEAVRRIYLAPSIEGLDPDAPTPIGIEPFAVSPEVSSHINDLLTVLIDRGGSDLHLTVGSPPQIRVNGTLEPIAGFESMRSEELRAMVYDILSSRQREALEENLELDAAHPIAGRGRFRMNVFFQRGSIGVALRSVPNRIPSLEELAMPPVVAELAMRPRGLVLVTGATGSGKSTTLAAMIDLVHQERAIHIMTVEDPIEFVHSHKKAIVNQREVGSDTASFAAAMRHALRQDPDVILVGEMRDLETISTVLTAAETGHLVLATLHTQDAPGSVERILDVFPPAQQQQVRVQLAETLQGVVSQQLVPTFDGTGRVAAVEVMVATPAIRNMIREGKVPQIKSAMQAGGQFGMQTMDNALADLLRSGQIEMAVATELADSPQDLMTLFGGRN